jgi:exodeoxyribonuclease V alpha subunit
MLRYSHRFGQVPGIGTLAAAVNASASVDTLDTLFDGRYDELQRLRINSSRDPVFERLVSDRSNGYGHYLTVVANPPGQDTDSETRDKWALRVLEAQGQFQLLVALRKGEFGVEGLNPRIETILRQHGLLGAAPAQPGVNGAGQPSAATWYAGRPVMVIRNDYNLALMNGDIGITLPYPNSTQGGRGTDLRVAFPTADPQQPVRWILPSRLLSVETVFAMTVHKSQGSEFNHTALILPQHDNPVLTRELIYTGITRAARQFTLIESNPGVLPQAVASSIFRASGLLHTINSMTASAGHQSG